MQGYATTTAKIVAVVVAYHPKAGRLAQLLARLAPQVAHTVCVDNSDAPSPPGSGTPHAEADSSITPDWPGGEQLTVLRLGHNAGIAHAQNLGIAHARQLGASHVLLMDQDSLPPPGLASRLLASLQDAPQTQPVAAIGPLCRDVKTGLIVPLIQRRGWRIQRRVPASAAGADASAASGPVSASGAGAGAGAGAGQDDEARASTASESAVPKAGGRIETSASDELSDSSVKPVSSTAASFHLHRVEYIPASGSLIDLALLDRVGPMQDDYFIDRVDVQWCLRARHLGLAIAVHPGVEMAHDQATRTVQLGRRTLFVGHDFRAYFHVRNSLAMALRAPIAPFWRVDQLLKLPAYMGFHIAVAERGQRRMAGLMACALLDALRGRMGLGYFAQRPFR